MIHRIIIPPERVELFVGRQVAWSINVSKLAESCMKEAGIDNTRTSLIHDVIYNPLKTDFNPKCHFFSLEDQSAEAIEKFTWLVTEETYHYVHTTSLEAKLLMFVANNVNNDEVYWYPARVGHFFMFKDADEAAMFKMKYT